MPAVSATAYNPPRDQCPSRWRGLGAIARQVAVDLTPQAVEQVATRVAALLHRQQQNQQQEKTRQELGMVTVSQLASYLKLNPAWVYEHADELGAIRIGSGPKARIRFDFQTAKAALAQHQASRTPAPADATSRRPRRQPETDLNSADAPLLDSRPRRILGARAFLARRPVPIGRI